MDSLFLSLHLRTFFLFFSAEKDRVLCEGRVDATYVRDIKGLFYALNSSYQNTEVAMLTLSELLQGKLQIVSIL